MQTDPVSNNRQALNQWVDRLACPACYGKLRFEPSTALCASCGRAYPIVDGIPVLIVERAEMPDAAS
jgi:uncharacterized protein